MNNIACNIHDMSFFQNRYFDEERLNAIVDQDSTPDNFVWHFRVNETVAELVPLNTHRLTAFSENVLLSHSNGADSFHVSQTPQHVLSVEQLEAALACLLPDDYKQFLQEHNGWRPLADYIEIEHLPGKATGVRWFLGIGLSEESDCIFSTKLGLSHRLPSRFLPIAYDRFDNVFCMSLSGEDRGKVYFCDIWSTPYPASVDPVLFVDGHVPDGVACYPVASSFQLFLSRLSSPVGKRFMNETRQRIFILLYHISDYEKQRFEWVTRNKRSVFTPTQLFTDWFEIFTDPSSRFSLIEKGAISFSDWDIIKPFCDLFREFSVYYKTNKDHLPVNLTTDIFWQKVMVCARETVWKLETIGWYGVLKDETQERRQILQQQQVSHAKFLRNVHRLQFVSFALLGLIRLFLYLRQR